MELYLYSSIHLHGVDGDKFAFSLTTFQVHKDTNMLYKVKSGKATGWPSYPADSMQAAL
jgi:hypothetical protein